jgi:carbonyl reductase 1
MTETVNTNYFGPRRVNDAFGKFLQRPGGRIVNIASASGPNYVSSLPADSPLVTPLSQPWTLQGGIDALDEMAATRMEGQPYGASKALLNAYTVIHAKIHTDLIINSVTPGWIATDMTDGMSPSNPATNRPSVGAIPPCYLMMDNDTIPRVPHGRYYGSDCLRSPLSFYRDPGEPPYQNDDDLVDLPASAQTFSSIFQS